MTFKSIGIGFLVTSVAAAAAETHVASVDVIKYATAVCGFVYAFGKLVSVTLTWVNHKVREAVAEEIDRKVGSRFAALPCAQQPAQTPSPQCDEERAA